MALSFACPCTQHLEIDDEYAGQDVQCPSCERIVKAPPKRAKVTVIAPPPAKQKPAPLKPAAVRDEDDDPTPISVKDDGGGKDRSDNGSSKRFSQSKKRKAESEFKDPAMREIMSKARTKDREDQEKRKRQQDEGGSTFSGGMVGGMVTMLIAVVWFVGGLACGILFYYPPILFIIGLITFFRGMMGHDD